VARKPSVLVRPLSMEEGRRLQKISRTAKDPVKPRRAILVLMSAQGQTVKDFTSLMQVNEVMTLISSTRSTNRDSRPCTQNGEGTPEDHR